MIYEKNYLVHYGVKGQKKGQRRYQNEDGTLTEEGKIHYGYYDRGDGTKDYKRLYKDAEKDAKEYAKAKAYYGEGAGTRRKKIKNLTSERMKDKDYKKAFEEFLSRQDMSKAQKTANRERKAQDTKNFVLKTGRGVKNLIYGFGSVSIPALATYALLKNTGADKIIKNAAGKILRNIGL